MPERGNHIHIHVSGVGFERLSWMAFLFEICLIVETGGKRFWSSKFWRQLFSWEKVNQQATGHDTVPDTLRPELRYQQHLSHHENHSLSSLSPVLSFLNSDMWAQSLEGTWHVKLHIKSQTNMRQDSLNSRCLTMIGNITKIRMLDVQLLTSLQKNKCRCLPHFFSSRDRNKNRAPAPCFLPWRTLFPISWIWDLLPEISVFLGEVPWIWHLDVPGSE